MYFAADIIRQYNTNNGTNKELKKCLQNNDTQEIIKFLGKRQQTDLADCLDKDKNNKIYCVIINKVNQTFSLKKLNLFTLTK